MNTSHPLSRLPLAAAALAHVALISAITTPAAAEALVYESFSYPAGGFNGMTAESGLGAWVSSGATITEPGLDYTDANSNELPTGGNKAYSSYKAHDAYANILATGWSASSVHDGRLNNKGATIWWGFLYDWALRDGWETHRFALESTEGGFVGLQDTSSGGGTNVEFAGRNDDGATVTGGSFNMAGTTFVVMRLATDASGNTVADMWFDPLLDGGESGLGTADASLTIAADSGDGILHFDRVHKDQLGHSATFSVDEIRMGESFESVIGVSVTPPAPFNLAVASSGSDLVFTWDSQAGKVYDLLSAGDLGGGPDTWSVWGAHHGIDATPDQNTLSVPRPGDGTRFFAIAERDGPPVFEDDFESDKGWVAGGSSGTPATAWQRGVPDSSGFVDPVFGPAAAASGTNCQGTNLTAVYGPDAAVTLTSPAFTVPAGGATLTFQQVINIDGPTAPIGEGADYGTLRVLDASDDSELAVIEALVEGGASSAWTEYTAAMPAEANGLSVKLEFGLFSDSDGGSPDTFELAGWYIDDVMVTAD